MVKQIKVPKLAIEGVNDLVTLRPDIAKLWHPTKNFPLLPEHIMPGSHLKVWWLCPLGHDFQVQPMVMTNKKKLGQKTICSVCKGRQILIGFNDLNSQFPKISEEWHTIKNIGMSPSEISHYSAKKVWWVCDNGHEWQMSVAARTANRRNCIYCSGKFILPGFNDLLTTHPEIAKEWHPSKNGNLKPTEITYGSNKRVWWICSKSHEWNTVLASRVYQNTGCKICSGLTLVVGVNDLYTRHPTLATEWHPTKNGKIRADHITSGTNKKFWWLCSLGHEFQASPNARIISSNVASEKRYTRCSICSNQKILPGFNDLATVQPEVAKSWNYNKNGKLTPMMFSQSNGKKVWWICDKGHEWITSIASRTFGTGCPSCIPKNISRLELAIYEEIRKEYPSAISGKVIYVKWGKTNRANIDILIPSLNTIVEYDGSYWHANKITKDTEKTQALLDAGYKVIRIRDTPLPFLGIKDENLIQFPHHKETAQDLAKIIIHGLLK